MFPTFHTNAQHRDLNIFTRKKVSMALNTNRINYVELKSVGAALLCWIIQTPANNTKVQNTKYKLQKIQNTKSKIQSKKYKVQSTEYKILPAG